MMLRSLLTSLAAAFAVVVAVGGCGTPGPTATKSSGATTSTTSGEATTLLKQAADVMRKVSGMHVNLTVQGDVANLRVTKLDGDISSTPQTVATGVATVLVGSKSEDAKFVFVDGHLYSDLGQPGSYTDFGNGASIYNVSVLLDPNKGLANLLTNLKNGSVAGSQQVNGVATTKITGDSSADDIATLAGSRLTDQSVTTVPTTIWTASDGSSHLVQIQIVPSADTSVTLTMSDWGKQVTATKPV
ncbi:LppX_LprAFG lipoprotein [Mycobacterium kubicae]|uniref:LppX_LprAFG lipoprotein n=1 Tax=Mycobacterium kubicae TaxID=120959 RepID=UPI001FD37EEB|nr:LppX_LprAFG lipoprotein [Mycobacterium kubicae]